MLRTGAHERRAAAGGNVFTPEVDLWEIALRTALIYGALLLALRLAGKRELGQMTPFDLVVILLVANAVQNAMVGPDTSLTGGLVAAGVLILTNYGLAALRARVPWLRSAIEGHAVLLINDGAFIEANLRKERVGREEVLMALREHGVDDPTNVRLAVLETDGTISVVPMSDTAPQRTKQRVRAHRGL
ncbi:MAG: DUF421 domain-containing protein [Chloroflexi bacterium]|nr:MAG: DUF421 domain-containing protein [Chloroflexota bacterium]